MVYGRFSKAPRHGLRWGGGKLVANRHAWPAEGVCLACTVLGIIFTWCPTFNFRRVLSKIRSQERSVLLLCSQDGLGSPLETNTSESRGLPHGRLCLSHTARAVQAAWGLCSMQSFRGPG